MASQGKMCVGRFTGATIQSGHWLPALKPWHAIASHLWYNSCTQRNSRTSSRNLRQAHLRPKYGKNTKQKVTTVGAYCKNVKKKRKFTIVMSVNVTMDGWKPPETPDLLKPPGGSFILIYNFTVLTFTLPACLPIRRLPSSSLSFLHALA